MYECHSLKRLKKRTKRLPHCRFCPRLYFADLHMQELLCKFPAQICDFFKELWRPLGDLELLRHSRLHRGYTHKKVREDESSGRRRSSLRQEPGPQSLLLHYHIFHMHLEANVQWTPKQPRLLPHTDALRLHRLTDAFVRLLLRYNTTLPRSHTKQDWYTATFQSHNAYANALAALE